MKEDKNEVTPLPTVLKTVKIEEAEDKTGYTMEVTLRGVVKLNERKNESINWDNMHTTMIDLKDFALFARRGILTLSPFTGKPLYSFEIDDLEELIKKYIQQQ